MSYDWHGTNSAPEGSLGFFDEIDRRFFNASPFYRGQRPFGALIPFASLEGKRVLEIGCGQGSHTQLLAQASSAVNAIDITERAVSLTKQRLELRRLNANVRQMDAEQMDFPDDEFDFVWSWGVVHHSAHTDRILREVARVLKPSGEIRFMVYNRRAVDTYVKVLRGILSGKLIRGTSLDDVLSSYTDGHLARFYTRKSLTRLIEENGLRQKSVSVLGQTSELLPLPGNGWIGRAKYGLLGLLPDRIVETSLKIAGSFLFAIAEKDPGC